MPSLLSWWPRLPGFQVRQCVNTWSQCLSYDLADLRIPRRNYLVQTIIQYAYFGVLHLFWPNPYFRWWYNCIWDNHILEKIRQLCQIRCPMWHEWVPMAHGTDLISGVERMTYKMHSRYHCKNICILYSFIVGDTVKSSTSLVINVCFCVPIT